MMVLADPSMHNKDRVVKHIKEFDKESPWPPILSFTTLWCRWIRVMAENLTVNLRDFPQHMINLHSLVCWGRMAGAEMAPGKRAVQLHRVSVEEPFEDVMVERSLTPLKFYYD